MHTAAPRAVLALVVLLCLALTGPAPAAQAEAAPVATTTSVALTSPMTTDVVIAVSVAVADGTPADGVVQLLIRSGDGSFELDLGQRPVRGTTVRTTYSVPRPGVYEVEARYAPSAPDATYAPSQATSTIDTRIRPRRLSLKARDLGNGVLEVAGNVSNEDGTKPRGGSFEVRVPGQAPVRLANDRSGLLNAFFEGLTVGRSYTAEGVYSTSAGSDELGATRRITQELTQARHSSHIGATGSSPRRGVARIAAYMYPYYPAGLVGKVAVRDLSTGDVVARIATMRYVEPVPGVVRTLTGVSRGVHRYRLTFTPAPQFRATTNGSTSPVLKIDVR